MGSSRINKTLDLIEIMSCTSGIEIGSVGFRKSAILANLF